MFIEQDGNTNSGHIYPTTTGRGKLILEFQQEVIEIEDLLKECIAEYRLKCSSSEVQTLIQEWKALYQRKTGEDISGEDFNATEVGKFILQHEAYEDIEKML